MSREIGMKGAPIIIIGENGMVRSDEKMWKLIGTPPKMKPPIPSKSKKSIQAELEFYQFKGSKTKCVRNRIDRLTDALDILVEREFEKRKLEKIEC